MGGGVLPWIITWLTKFVGFFPSHGTQNQAADAVVHASCNFSGTAWRGCHRGRERKSTTTTSSRCEQQCHRPECHPCKKKATCAFLSNQKRRPKTLIIVDLYAAHRLFHSRSPPKTKNPFLCLETLEFWTTSKCRGWTCCMSLVDVRRWSK